jgi:hypothetical protein
MARRFIFHRQMGRIEGPPQLLSDPLGHGHFYPQLMQHRCKNTMYCLAWELRLAGGLPHPAGSLILFESPKLGSLVDL